MQVGMLGFTFLSVTRLLCVMDMLSNEWDIDVMEVYDNDGQPNKYTLFNYEVGDKIFEDGRDAMDYIHSLNLDSDAFRAMMQSILNP